MPRQMPRYGIASSRATRQARIFPSQPREPKPPGTSTPSTPASSARASSSVMFSASTQRTRDAAAGVDARVLERLVDGEVGVVELHVLADERDLDRLAALAEPLDEVVPLAEVGVGRVDPELLADEPVEALLLHRLRHEVDVGDVDRGDHGLGVDVGEERDLVADVLGERLGRAADEDVGMDTDAAQLVDRVLGGLRLQLAGVRR